MGSQLFGELLSSHVLAQAREIGVYSAEDFQSLFTQCDANGVLELLECLDLCVQVSRQYSL